MKANELMIGDWVYFFDAKNPNDKQITEVSAVRVEYNEGDIKFEQFSDFWFEEGRFAPIPLTAEILEKNAYPEDGIWYSFGDFYVAPYGDCFVIHIHSYDDKRDFLCRIHYIHELQHALRLCGLNDLADNFKIE